MPCFHPNLDEKTKSKKYIEDNECNKGKVPLPLTEEKKYSMKVGIASLIFGLFFLYLALISSIKVETVVWSLPLSKGCSYPAKEVRFIKTELKRIMPVAQIHKCTYDSSKRLIRVRTYNFERGYQMKKPTEEVIYKWNHFRLSQFSVRKATHGNGEIDIEVYKLYN